MRKVKKSAPRRRKKASPIDPAPSPFFSKFIDPASDPYEIHAPAGKEYQWIAIAVLGEPVDDGWLENFRRKGWKRVLAKRHPQFTSPDKYITRDGLRLYERKIPKDRPALTEANLAAIKQFNDHAAAAVKSESGYVMPVSWNVSVPYEHVPSDTPALQIEVLIPVWLSGRYQDAARALGLTNEVYAQRRILLHLRGEIDGLLMPADGAFDLIQKPFHWQRDKN